MHSEEIYYSKMDSFISLNQYQNAIQLSEARIKMYPEDKAYRTRDIANIYYYKGDMDSAIIKYTEAILLTSFYITAYVDRGWAYMEIDSIDWAIKDFKFAASYNWSFYFDLGIAQEEKGSLENAIDSYNKYLEHYPENQKCLARRDSILQIINNNL